MSKISKVITEVESGLLATGSWMPATSEHRYMKLKSLVDGIELRIDLMPEKATVFPVKRHLANGVIVGIDSCDILTAVSEVLAACRDTLAE